MRARVVVVQRVGRWFHCVVGKRNAGQRIAGHRPRAGDQSPCREGRGQKKIVSVSLLGEDEDEEGDGDDDSDGGSCSGSGNGW